MRFDQVSRRAWASRCCASSVPSRPTSVAPTVGRAAAAAIPSSSVDFPEPFSPTKQVTRAERSSDGMVAMADTENGNAGSPGGGPCFKPTVRRWGTALIDAAGRARSQRRGGVGHGGGPFEGRTTPRSEERRGGEKGRTRGAPDHLKKKKEEKEGEAGDPEAHTKTCTSKATRERHTARV